MIAIGFGFLALLAVISILLGGEDSSQRPDPQDEALLWMRFGIR